MTKYRAVLRPLQRCPALLRTPISQHWPTSRQHRSFGIDTLTTILLPPTVFGGLLISLWTYKCIMMVIFQNKIIYMPSVPPFSRSEKVEQYAVQCRPVIWQEHEIRSIDGTKVKLLEGQTHSDRERRDAKQVVVLYFQGNASSLPPRLPYLSQALKSAHALNVNSNIDVNFTIVALSYRGFWTSAGRPSQIGIEMDTQAALQWIFQRFQGTNTEIIVWGQSIGAGAASVSLANLTRGRGKLSELDRISGLILETPFTNLRAMLIALYPQKFLPYRYLAPFLRSTWDSQTALASVTESKTKLDILILEAGSDELVPQGNASTLRDICTARGATVRHVVIPGALHTEVMSKSQGRQEIARFIASFGHVSREVRDD